MPGRVQVDSQLLLRTELQKNRLVSSAMARQRSVQNWRSVDASAVVLGISSLVTSWSTLSDVLYVARQVLRTLNG